MSVRMNARSLIIYLFVASTFATGGKMDKKKFALGIYNLDSEMSFFFPFFHLF